MGKLVVSHKPNFPETSGAMFPSLGGRESLWQMLEHSPSQATRWSLLGSSFPRANLQQQWLATATATSCPSLLQAKLTYMVTVGTIRVGEEGMGLDASGGSDLFSQLFPSPLWDVVSLPSILYPSLYPHPFPCDFVALPSKGAQLLSCS